MALRLAMTVTGIGDDGRDYTIRGYKNDNEALVSVCETHEGEVVYCRSEKPLVFWIPATGVTIRCPDQD